MKRFIKYTLTISALAGVIYFVYKTKGPSVREDYATIDGVPVQLDVKDSSHEVTTVEPPKTDIRDSMIAGLIAENQLLKEEVKSLKAQLEEKPKSNVVQNKKNEKNLPIANGPMSRILTEFFANRYASGGDR